MPNKPSLAFVAFALITFAEGSMTPPSFADALDEALVPGKSVLRYNRLWRLPQHTVDDGWISGRIGFEDPTASVGVWDEQRKDYGKIRPAQVTGYVIHAETGRVAFELKSSTIQPWTFKGNFQALLNQESAYQWRVALEDLSQPSWEDWVKSITRITDIRIRMERPNPGFPGKQVEDLFEEAKLNAATLAVQGDNVDLSEAELIKQSFALGRKHGHVHAKGVSGPDAAKREWRSEEEGIADREQAPRDTNTREVPAPLLRRLLEKRNKSKPVK